MTICKWILCCVLVCVVGGCLSKELEQQNARLTKEIQSAQTSLQVEQSLNKKTTAALKAEIGELKKELGEAKALNISLSKSLADEKKKRQRQPEITDPKDLLPGIYKRSEYIMKILIGSFSEETKKKLDRLLDKKEGQGALTEDEQQWVNMLFTIPRKVAAGEPLGEKEVAWLWSVKLPYFGVPHSSVLRYLLREHPANKEVIHIKPADKELIRKTIRRLSIALKRENVVGIGIWLSRQSSADLNRNARMFENTRLRKLSIPQGE